jgi:hypothetical protein
LESVAFNVMSRIEEVITADNHAREKAKKDAPEIPQRHDPRGLGEMDDQSKTTLLDFMGWTGDAENKNNDSSPPPPPEPSAQDDGRLMKLPNIMTNLKQTYMDKLDFLGGHRSPTGHY